MRRKGFSLVQSGFPLPFSSPPFLTCLLSLSLFFFFLFFSVFFSHPFFLVFFSLFSSQLKSQVLAFSRHLLAQLHAHRDELFTQLKSLLNNNNSNNITNITSAHNTNSSNPEGAKKFEEKIAPPSSFTESDEKKPSSLPKMESASLVPNKATASSEHGYVLLLYKLLELFSFALRDENISLEERIFCCQSFVLVSELFNAQLSLLYTPILVNVSN